MPQGQQTRNYQAFPPSEGTGVRSTEKEIERNLLQAAFLGVEGGNLDDEAIDTRVIAADSVTLEKLSPPVRALLGSGGLLVNDVITASMNNQTSFTLSMTPTEPTSVIAIYSGLDQDYGVDYSVTGQVLNWFSPDFNIDAGENLKVRYFIQQGSIAHDHNDIYYTKTELGGVGGASLIGDDDTYSSIDPSPLTPVTVKGMFSGINNIIGLTGKRATGQYVGNNANDRLIALPFQPKFIAISRANGMNSSLIWKVETMAGKQTLTLSNQSNVVNSASIVAFFASGFTVDNDINGNASGEQYYFIALG